MYGILIEKRLFKPCEVLDVHEELNRMRRTHKRYGWEIRDVLPCSYTLVLDDGYVVIGWEDGAIYEYMYQAVQTVSF